MSLLASIVSAPVTAIVAAGPTNASTLPITLAVEVLPVPASTATAPMIELASTSRTVFVAPDACPASLGLTEPSTAFAAGAKTSAIPVPAATKPGTSAA